jgi:DNA-binding transcriptional LysR family regulator
LPGRHGADHQMRRRADPLADVWDSEVVPLLKGAPGLTPPASGPGPEPRLPVLSLPFAVLRRRTRPCRAREFEKRGESVVLDVLGVLALDETDLMLRAALAGEGLAYLADFATADHVAGGRLERVLEDWSPAYPGLRLYYPSPRNVPAKLRAFIELIREQGR